MYYNRQGESISSQEWGRLKSEDFTKIALDYVGEYRVSTVWLGIEHGWEEGKPLIFETMIFHGEGFRDLYMDRYTTEFDAICGHLQAKIHAKRHFLNKPITEIDLTSDYCENYDEGEDIQ